MDSGQLTIVGLVETCVLKSAIQEAKLSQNLITSAFLVVILPVVD